ncbi:MAG: hypothetical protein QXP70_01680 [Methanomassiliicoccales archaeon]
MNDEENYSLVKGSVYRITSAGSGEATVVTVGTFLGYLPLGDESAIALRIEEGENAGTVRLIPCNSIFFLDVIKQEREEKTPKKKEEIKFYG